MKTVKNLLGKKLLLMVLIFAFISCGNSNEQKESQSDNSVKKEKKEVRSSENFGKIELSLSGDLQGERIGVADFYHGSARSTEWWEIRAHHGRVGKQKFSFNLKLTTMNQELSQPKPGTYKIGFVPNSTEVFAASFIDIIDSENHVQKEYGTMPGEGTLTIEVSNENQVKGHFEFTAHSLDDMMNVEDQVTVKGKFDAVNRMRNQ